MEVTEQEEFMALRAKRYVVFLREIHWFFVTSVVDAYFLIFGSEFARDRKSRVMNR